MKAKSIFLSLITWTLYIGVQGQESTLDLNQPLPNYLTSDTQIGQEISITGKWIPKKNGGFFGKSADAKDLVKEWNDIYEEARKHDGMLSTEINHSIGEEAELVHHVFRNSESLTTYFKEIAPKHLGALKEIAKPDMQMVRGVEFSDEVIETIKSTNVDVTFGEYLFGFVKNDYEHPNLEKAIQVTAKWTCKPGEDKLDELIYWWQQVGTDAYHMEEGLIRFEVYQVPGENALIIHETFDTTKELMFHLTKGTAAKYKKDIDQIAVPERYFFRGPVSWTIRTYSKIMGLPATYTRLGNHYDHPEGSMSNGLF